jgi:hypothetical protein
MALTVFEEFWVQQLKPITDEHIYVRRSDIPFAELSWGSGMQELPWQHEKQISSSCKSVLGELYSSLMVRNVTFSRPSTSGRRTHQVLPNWRRAFPRSKTRSSICSLAKRSILIIVSLATRLSKRTCHVSTSALACPTFLSNAVTLSATVHTKNNPE